MIELKKNMKASEAIDGQMYKLGARAGRPNGYKDAVCNGWNHMHNGILFLVFDEYGKRKIHLVDPSEEIEKI